MIGAQRTGRDGALERTLLRRATALAQARGKQRLLRLSTGTARWRSARFLWPLFGGVR